MLLSKLALPRKASSDVFKQCDGRSRITLLLQPLQLPPGVRQRLRAFLAGPLRSDRLARGTHALVVCPRRLEACEQVIGGAVVPALTLLFCTQQHVEEAFPLLDLRLQRLPGAIRRKTRPAPGTLALSSLNFVGFEGPPHGRRDLCDLRLAPLPLPRELLLFLLLRLLVRRIDFYSPGRRCAGTDRFQHRETALEIARSNGTIRLFHLRREIGRASCRERV